MSADPVPPPPRRRHLHERLRAWFRHKARSSGCVSLLVTAVVIAGSLLSIMARMGEGAAGLRNVLSGPPFNFHFAVDATPAGAAGASGKELLRTVQPAAQGTLVALINKHLTGPAPAAEIVVSCQIGSRGEARELSNGEPLSSADGYRVLFRPDEPAYFYVLQIDGRGHLDWLFPRNTTNPLSMGQNPVAAGEIVSLPSDHESFMLDENLGTERILIVSTTQPFAAMEQQLTRLASPSQALLAASPNAVVPAAVVDPGKHVAFTRGVAGTRPSTAKTPLLAGGGSGPPSQVVRTLQGTSGVLAKEFWFQHVAPPKDSKNP